MLVFSDSYQEKDTIPYDLLNISILKRRSYLLRDRWSKLALLHRAKERKPPSLSNQPSVYTFPPEGGVVWNLPYCINMNKIG